jgi:hypothetical protein
MNVLKTNNCHNLKPFGLADFTESAVLQGACGRILQLCTPRLASSANSTIAQLRNKSNISQIARGSTFVDPYEILL